jgi:hypothetical protein
MIGVCAINVQSITIYTLHGMEMLPMDDYHEFKHAHEVWIEEWWLYWSPHYVSIIRGTIVVPSVIPTFFGGSLTNDLVPGTLDLPLVGKKSCLHLTS